MWALVVMEGVAMSFWLLLVCVAGIANGPVNMVVFYEREVKERVVELGLISRDQIQRISLVTGIALFVPLLVVVPALVYGLNGAQPNEGIVQMIAIYWIMGLFDRLFIDWYWVGHTKAWQIPGTEDLQPYIPKKALIIKWICTLVGFPVLAGILGLAYRFVVL